MATFDEKDIIYKDYVDSTTTGDNPNYIAIQDRKRTNKNELYEVVWFCDAFVKRYTVPKTIESFQKVERLLILPQISNIVIRNELNDFVAKNWNKVYSINDN